MTTTFRDPIDEAERIWQEAAEKAPDDPMGARMAYARLTNSWAQAALDDAENSDPDEADFHAAVVLELCRRLVPEVGMQDRLTVRLFAVWARRIRAERLHREGQAGDALQMLDEAESDLNALLPLLSADEPLHMPSSPLHFMLAPELCSGHDEPDPDTPSAKEYALSTLAQVMFYGALVLRLEGETDGALEALNKAVGSLFSLSQNRVRRGGPAVDAVTSSPAAEMVTEAMIGLVAGPQQGVLALRCMTMTLGLLLERKGEHDFSEAAGCVEHALMLAASYLEAYGGAPEEIGESVGEIKELVADLRGGQRKELRRHMHPRAWALVSDSRPPRSPRRRRR